MLTANKNQADNRADILSEIISSPSHRKMIVAGAGTGKTFTFLELLKNQNSKNNLALTFIRKLAAEMEEKLGELAYAGTFHKFCKKEFHGKKGSIILAPYLCRVIHEDAQALRYTFTEFEEKFQNLEETAPELIFYLERGDYYDAISFNDSVYRLLKIFRSNPKAIPTFDQIVIDEYQDFNRLEVEFISILEQNSKILIVGDDDQAVYFDRGSSPRFLQEKAASGNYELFQLPFCSRCTEVIVSAVNALIKNAQSKGYLKNRIEKKYECFLPDKKTDSGKYPKILYAHCTVVSTVIKFIDRIISERITVDEIAESWENGYPTILIVGPKQYLNALHKKLYPKHAQISYFPSKEPEYSAVDAYDLLISDEKSNLGWRLLVSLFDPKKLRDIIKQSNEGKLIIECLDPQFISIHIQVLADIQFIIREKRLPDNCDRLRQYLNNEFDRYTNDLLGQAKEEVVTDKTKPSIQMTSFVGCKGLSAGHVIIVGFNNNEFSHDESNINDSEICQFIVALTRTRKCCYLISNSWLYNPQTEQKKSVSGFIKWLPRDDIQTLGSLNASNIDTTRF